VVLFLLPGVVAAGLEYRGHYLDGDAVSVLVSVALGLPLLWLAWAAYRESRTATGMTLVEVADRLAAAVEKQWEIESRIRRLNDPYPMSVSWGAADATLADGWAVLIKLATSGAGWPRTPVQAGWAKGPDQLAGSGNQLADVFGRVPTRRLAVLGEPGSGKTILMVRLVLDLLRRRMEGDPVPVLVPMASWDPSRQDLTDWLAVRLVTDYPGLAAAGIARSGHNNLAQELLAGGLILPILDGLDEMPWSSRGRAVSHCP
jgi:NACHT domain